MNYTLEDIKKQSPYPIGELNTAYAKYFVGNSYLYSINNQEVNISNVTFEPGLSKQLAYPSWCRTDLIMYCRKRVLSGMGKTCSGTQCR